VKHQLLIISGFKLYLFLCSFFIPLVSFGVETTDNIIIDDSDYIYIKIKINGLNKAMKKKVLSLIGLKDFNYETYVSDTKIKNTYQESLTILATYMKSQGFYQAKIASSLKKMYNSWTAVYSITPGPRVIITSVNIKVNGPGKEFTDLQQYLNNYPQKINDNFIHADYENAKNNLIKLITASGYLNAKLTTHEVAIDLRQHTADINLVLETGMRFYFGSITVEENKIDPALIQKFIILNEGEPYSSSKIIEQQNALSDSDYYSEILIKPHRDLMVNNKIPIEITTKLRKPSKYSIGMGYSTDSGINGRISWSRRRLNYQGHRLYVGAVASKIFTTVGARYRIPFRNPRNDEYVITTNFIQTTTDTSESRIAQSSIARSILRGEWREILALDLQRELYSIGQQEDSADILLPNATWSWVVPRGQLYVSKGHLLSLDVRGSSKAVLSKTNFIQGEVNTKWIFPVLNRGRVLARARLGASDVTNVLDLPASFRYFTGGDQSIRGYSFASLGPKNSTGVVIGSIEYDFRIKGNWSVAAFYDAGNAFNDISDIEIAEGVGIGIRWKTIVGQIKVDIASAISELDKPKRLHISIGPDF